jgi:hypothetical protein
MSGAKSAIKNIQNALKNLQSAGKSAQDALEILLSQEEFKDFPLLSLDFIHVVFTDPADASSKALIDDYIAFTASPPTPTPAPTAAPPTPAPTFMPTLGSCAVTSSRDLLDFPLQISADDIGSDIESGIRIVGGVGAGVGASIAVGDIDNDGREDTIIGAPNANKIYVVFGKTLTGPSLNVAAIETGTIPGIVIQSDSTRRTAPISHLGTSVASGDINLDGKDDIAFSTSVSTCVVFGGVNLPQIIDYNDIVSSNLGVCTPLVSPAHIVLTDFNGDGSDDLIVPSVDQINIFLGDPSMSSNTNLTDSLLSISLNITDGSYLWASAVGDLNEDHKQDLLITMQFEFSSRDTLPFPYAFIIFGIGIVDVRGPSTLELFDIGKPGDTAGVLIDGSAIFPSFIPNNPSKNSGDFNNDGYNDIAISNQKNLDVFIIYGPFNSDNNYIDISTIGTNDTKGVLFLGSDLLTDNTRRVNSLLPETAGSLFKDLNNDNITDFIIGYTGHDGPTPQSGKAYIVFGHNNPDAEISLLNLTSQITLIEGSYIGFGSSLASGDVNCDGIPDLLVGAPVDSQIFGRRGLVESPTPAPAIDDNVFIFFGFGA